MSSWKRNTRGAGYVIRWRDPDGSQRQLTVATRELAVEHHRRAATCESLGQRYDPHRGRSAPTLQDAVVAYLRARSATLAEGTIKLRSVTLADFVRFAGDHTRRRAPRVGVLSRSLLEEYQHHLRTRTRTYFRHPNDGRKRVLYDRCSASTAHDRIVHVYGLWRWLYDHDVYGEWVERPRKVDTVPPVHQQKPAPSWAEMDQAIEHASIEHVRQMMIVMRCTGLRRSQALRLEWRDIDLDRGLLTVRPELGKTRQEKRGRRVPLAPALVEEMAGWGVREGHLIAFPEGQHRRVHHTTARRPWERAGLDGFAASACHSFRRGFVSGLAMAGVRDEIRKFLVGHARGTHGDVYTDPYAIAEEAREAVALVPQLCASGAQTIEFKRNNEGSN